MKGNPITIIIIAVLVAVCPVRAPAGTITLTLDNVYVTECYETDSEAGCLLWFEATTSEDEIAGYCLFVPHAEALGKIGVYIWPARLVVDLTTLQGIESAEIDIYETHFAGSTRAFFYEQGSLVASTQSYQEDEQTLVLDAGGGRVDRLAVSAHESYVWEIRLSGSALVPGDGVSFGAIKSLYR